MMLIVIQYQHRKPIIEVLQVNNYMVDYMNYAPRTLNEIKQAKRW